MGLLLEKDKQRLPRCDPKLKWFSN